MLKIVDGSLEKKMQKFVIKTGSFAILVFAIVWLVGMADNLDRFSSTNSNILRLRLAARQDSLDILFIGNSYAYSAIMPSAFDSLGLRTFNLGTATAGPLFYRIILEDYFNNSVQNPKIVAMTISPTTFSHLSDNFESYPIHRYLQMPLLNEAIAIEQNSPTLYYALFQKSAKKAIGNLTSNEPPRQHALTITEKGFFPDSQVFNDSVYRETAFFYHALKQDHFDREKSNRLIELAHDLEAREIKVVFIEVPTNRLSDFLSPKFLEEYQNFKRGLRSRFNTVSYPLDLQSRYYRNIDHMNAKGAAVFSEFITNEPALVKNE